MEVPAAGIANTRPEDMDEETFAAWLDCIPEEKRADWVEKRKNVIWHSKPASDAIIIDLRFQALTLSLYTAQIDRSGRYIEIKQGEKYSETFITNYEQKPKGKKNTRADLTIFAIGA